MERKLLDCVLLDNNELMCAGYSLGFLNEKQLECIKDFKEIK